MSNHMDISTATQPKCTNCKVLILPIISPKIPPLDRSSMTASIISIPAIYMKFSMPPPLNLQLIHPHNYLNEQRGFLTPPYKILSHTQVFSEYK